jgi:uncharacterized protein YndB with AHSA1/START domain
MEDLQLTRRPEAKVQMLIRRPVDQVFEAFVDPAITSRFWFSKGSGRLEAGKQVRWDWEMYGVFAQVDVKAIDKDKRIVIDWSSPGEAATTVEWNFDARTDGTTLVKIVNSGFVGDGDRMVDNALDSKGGFSFVLAGLKAFLEHGVALSLVADHAPDHVVRR